MTSSTDIIAKSEASFEAFERTDGRTNDLYVTQTYDAIVKIFHFIRYDSVGARRNLMGLINEDTAYTTEYGESSPGRSARVSTLETSTQRRTLPLTAKKRRPSTRQGLWTGKSTMWQKMRLTVLSSASSQMSGSLHFRRGVLPSTRSGFLRSCWTRSRSSTQEKYGRCTSPQTQPHNISRRWRRCSCKRPGQKCLSRITIS